MLLTARVAQDDKLIAALRPLVGAISIETMRQANGMVDLDADKRTVEQAAAWLATKLVVPRK